jgi:hypothetical protein
MNYEAFEIETDGIVLLSLEIRMRLTPSRKRTGMCHSAGPRKRSAGFHWSGRSGHKVAPSVRNAITI